MTTGTGTLSLRSAMSETNSPACTQVCSDFGAIQCAEDATPDDGQSRHSLTDEQREAAVRRAGASLERHMLLRENALFEYDVTGDLGAKGEADRQRILATEAMRLQAELIRGRSPEVVARMEAERGLA